MDQLRRKSTDSEIVLRWEKKNAFIFVGIAMTMSINIKTSTFFNLLRVIYNGNKEWSCMTVINNQQNQWKMYEK